MARAPQLPERLRYLGLVRKRLSALPSQEVNEDMDTTAFEEALRKRTKGLALEEATRVLHEDRAELQQWLARPGNEESRLHFFYGYLLIAADSIEELLNPSPEPPPFGDVNMEIPAGGRAKRQDPALEVCLGGATLMLFPNNKAGFELNVETLNIAASLEKGAAVWSCTKVRFGGVRGIKFVRVASALGLKEAHYALEVPGGYCTAQITGQGTDWLESKFERCFGSIRVIGTQ